MMMVLFSEGVNWPKIQIEGRPVSWVHAKFPVLVSRFSVRKLIQCTSSGRLTGFSSRITSRSRRQERSVPEQFSNVVSFRKEAGFVRSVARIQYQ